MELELMMLVKLHYLVLVIKDTYYMMVLTVWLIFHKDVKSQ